MGATQHIFVLVALCGLFGCFANAAKDYEVCISTLNKYSKFLMEKKLEDSLSSFYKFSISKNSPSSPDISEKSLISVIRHGVYETNHGFAKYFLDIKKENPADKPELVCDRFQLDILKESADIKNFKRILMVCDANELLKMKISQLKKQANMHNDLSLANVVDKSDMVKKIVNACQNSKAGAKQDL